VTLHTFEPQALCAFSQLIQPFDLPLRFFKVLLKGRNQPSSVAARAIFDKARVICFSVLYTSDRS